MSIPTSVLDDLFQHMPELRSQMYFKASLIALSHAMEDQVLANAGETLIIANFQREKFYRQEAHRYRRIANLHSQVYVLAAPETDFKSSSEHYEKIAFNPDDALANEWHLVVIGSNYAACLVCRERHGQEDPQPISQAGLTVDHIRRFEGIWTFNRQVSQMAAGLMFDRILHYRPELSAKIADARSRFLEHDSARSYEIDPDPFAHRLMTYLQAGQYKLLKAYRSIAAQERQERLLNLITAAIRQSLDPKEIFKIAVWEIGQVMRVCRCIVYPCKPGDKEAVIEHEYLSSESLNSLVGHPWPLRDNPLFQTIAKTQEAIAIEDTHDESNVNLSTLSPIIREWHLRSWLMVPITHQGQLIGMMELHGCGPQPRSWRQDDLSMLEAIAAQLGIGLIQAEAYANLETLNQQLEALEVTRSNLIAITGHELRTPLSTIQVCLESLASEPDMPMELRQVMLSTALDDAERLRTLVQDFLTLSQLESGRTKWHFEALSMDECVSLALSSIRARQQSEPLPSIVTDVPQELPLVKADGEWLVEVLSKLLDNACKFTEPKGEVTINAQRNGLGMLEVTITDTGRGIEPNRLEAVFDRFYQEEGALRRTAGGTGLGLAICRQVIFKLGGQIWANSEGRDKGSQFHFTVPVIRGNEAEDLMFKGSPAMIGQPTDGVKKAKRRKRSPTRRR
ncbi:MAG: DICT sensory domain-containing protein [Elainellaceae cyanobacterium]